jgi:ABC-type branched-subunit amino acid transport system substrate-binding protein
VNNLKWITASLAVGALTLALSGCATASDSSTGDAGDPVKVMVYGTFSQPPYALPQVKEAAEAAVAYVNGNGGAGGKQIELISCDDNMTPDGGALCAQQAIEENVVAVVGSWSLFSDPVVAELEAAGIPNILPTAISPAENISPQTYAVFSSSTLGAAGLPFLKEQGCETVVLAAPENPQLENNYATYLLPAAVAAGVEMELVAYPGTTTDFTTVAQQISDKSSCVLYGGGAPDSTAIIKAIYQIGGTDIINMPLSTLAVPEGLLADLGEAADSILVPSPFFLPSTGSEAITTAVDEMKKVNPSIIVDDSAINAYAAVLTFAEAAGMVDGEITAASLGEVLSGAETVIDTGLYPALNFSKSFGWFPPAPRAAANTFQLYKASEGQYVPVGDPVDVAKLLKF